MTSQGVIRYPGSPWGPDDTSSDQIAPLVAACGLADPALGSQVVNQLIGNGWKTGNGKIATLGLWSQVRRFEHGWFLWLSDLALVGQAIAFKLPFTYVNGSFQRNDGTADYLNFACALACAKASKTMTWTARLAMKLTSASKVLQKITAYYNPEPNCFVIPYYQQAIPKIWGS